MLRSLALTSPSDGFACFYETGMDDVQQFDAHIEIYTQDRHIKVTFDTLVPPYCRESSSLICVVHMSRDCPLLPRSCRPIAKETIRWRPSDRRLKTLTPLNIVHFTTASSMGPR